MTIAEATDTGRAAELRDFEQRARAFLDANVAKLDEVSGDDVGGEARGPEVIEREKVLQEKIFNAGFAGLTFPKEYGGQGLGEEEQTIWQNLVGNYAVPRSAFAVSHGMCGPIINLLGTDEQKKKYLPDLWRGKTIFAQMFSEPGNGSDVAGLQTRAEKVDGGWKMTGQKVWTTNAQYCDHGVIIARTNPDVPKHQGISMFIINLRDPAVTIRPLQVASGDRPFNEIFIDGLFVPDSDLLGEVDKGWDASVAMLRFERIFIGTSSTKTVGPLAFDNLVEAARESGLSDDTNTRRALAEAYVLERGGDLLALRMRQESEAGIELMARGSIGKLAGALANWRLTEILSDIQGLPLVAWESDADAGELDYPPITHSLAGAPAAWTAGGTIEIQRNIIGDRVLLLEKDPQVDRGIPFREIRRSA